MARMTRMTRTDLLGKLGVEHPIIQAPLAGAAPTPQLIAAVANAGGLGSLGAAYMTPDEITSAVRRIRALTDRPFLVNLFAGGYHVNRVVGDVDPGPMLAVLAEAHAALGLPAPVLPELPPDPFEAQLDAVLEARPSAFSFTFGVPSGDALRRLRERDIAIIGTATTADEARLLADAGVDAIVAQGEEAGGHRGTFAGPFERAMVPTSELVRHIRAAVAVPVIASGGIMDGREVAAALALGAAAVQLGTAFLVCPESGAAEAYKRALLAAREDATVITRAFSGRPARGLANAFIARLAGREDIILPYPLQNVLTRAMRAAAARRGEAGYLSLWAGRGVARSRALPAGALVRRLVEEALEAAGARPQAYT